MMTPPLAPTSPSAPPQPTKHKGGSHTTDAKVPDRTEGVGQLGVAAAWIFAVCCVPYLVLKVLWTVGISVGITDRSVLASNEWAAENALTAVIQLAGLLLILALTRKWARRVPAWLLLFPVWVGTGLLFQVTVGAVLLALFSPLSQTSTGSTGAFEPWIFVMVYLGFAGQGVALVIAFACYVRARWGRLLGQPTGAVLARRTARVRSWPENHLAELSEVVAGMALVVALLCLYWAVGGSFGLSDAQPHDPWVLQASRVTGAVIAVVGLLGLAGKWGHQTRFWLPAALLWIGSGALVGFDGLTLGINKLFVTVGTDASVPSWSLTDTFLLVKVVIGVLVGAAGALALTAGRDNQERAGS